MLYTTPEYFEEIKGLLASLEGLSYSSAMGDYVLVYDKKLVGGIYCNRFMVKITPISLELLAPTAYCIPYPGAKEMLLVERRDPEFLKELIVKTAEQLPSERRYRENH